MAISVTNWVWCHSRSRHGARLVLLFLADSTRTEGGWAWPSNKEIGTKAGISERGVQVAIKELEKLGELEVSLNGGPKGCNRYRVICTPAESAPPQNLRPADVAPPQDLLDEEKAQANGHNPAESARGAESAPPQNPAETPADSAPGTVSEPKNSSTKSSSRGTRIPDDFTVTAEMAQWARENVPDLIQQGRGKRETQKFINFWRGKAGKDATKIDWPATWRNWMLNADEGRPSGRPPSSGQSAPADHRREWERNRS